MDGHNQLWSSFATKNIIINPRTQDTSSEKRPISFISIKENHLNDRYNLYPNIGYTLVVDKYT